MVNVPYDPLLPMIFQGEEISIGIRGFTVGYDIYAPQRSVCFHKYTDDNAEKKETVPLFWEHAGSYDGYVSQLIGLLLMDFESHISI